MQENRIGRQPKKDCKKLGVQRNKIIEDFMAVILCDYGECIGDERYVKLLIEYNEVDAVYLKRIADFTVEGYKKQ